MQAFEALPGIFLVNSYKKLYPKGHLDKWGDEPVTASFQVQCPLKGRSFRDKQPIIRWLKKIRQASLDRWIQKEKGWSAVKDAMDGLKWGAVTYVTGKRKKNAKFGPVYEWCSRNAKSISFRNRKRVIRIRTQANMGAWQKKEIRGWERGRGWERQQW